MIDRIRRGIPAYEAELVGLATYPDTIRDDPVLVELQSIACQSASVGLTAAQKDDVIRQVTLRAEYLRSAALVAAAIVEDTHAALAAAPSRPAPERFDPPPIAEFGTVHPLYQFAPVGPAIESAPVGVEGPPEVNPAEPALPEPRRRGRSK